MNKEVMFSSKTVEHETPDELFDTLNQIFDFRIDVCATVQNTKCPTFFTKERNGLEQEWKGRCWMNPPYGREIGAWVQKAYNESQKPNCTVVALLPARTDTIWWHNYVIKSEVFFLRGRLKFGNQQNSAPFPSAIAVFRQNVRDMFYFHGLDVA